MPKLIREGRFGPPKSYKTGAVMSSYPRPILGITMKREEMDVIKEPVDWIEVADLAARCKTTPKPVSAIACGNIKTFDLLESYNIPADNTTWPNLVKVVNTLLTAGCPWKTVVIDNTTDLSTAILRHLSATNNGMLADARKWAPAISAKVEQIIEVCSKLPCHFIILMHEETEKNETTSQVSTTPALFAKFRERVGGGLSQMFYQVIEGGKPMVYTQSQGFVKGIGARWPSDLPAKVGPLFNDIYGKAITTGEIEKP